MSHSFHAAFVRRRLSYLSGPSGRAVQGLFFEVICPQCGDDGGALLSQPAAALSLRGPYERAEAAERAASAHRLRSVRTVTGWAVGGPEGRLVRVAEG